MSFFKDKNFIKKYIIGLFLMAGIMFYSFGLFQSSEVEAFDCASCSTWWTQLTSLSTDVAHYIETERTNIVSIAWATFRKEMIDYMTDELVNWIQGGGNPKFVTDWNGFLTEVADNAGGKVLEDILGKDFMAGLCQPDWAIKIRIGLQKPPKFTTKARCTLSDIGVNFTDFMDNFNNGGWKGWISVSESQNNPYGLYIMTLNEKLDKERIARTGAENDAKTGSGFLSDKVCRAVVCADFATGESNTMTGSYTEEDVNTIQSGSEGTSSCGCMQWETRTPGKIVADGLNQSVFKDIEWLKNSEEWQNMVVAVTTAVINRVTKEGVMALTSTSSKEPSPLNVSNYKDIVPPKSTASVSDPWHIKISVNETVLSIYYTLDGSNPTTFSSQYDGPISIISSTNLSAPLSPLKWFAVDKAFNEEEEIRTLSVSAPFSVPGLQTPSSVIVPISPTSITFLSNEPAVIYYTIDGTTPDTFSPKFTKQINLNLNEATIISWFAVDQDGNREGVHTLVTQPVFPNNELTYIVDLVAPTASISAPATASSGSQFTLNPSSSVDNDRTPLISMYEWDFDNDGVYDWKTVDYNRDGVFDEQGCRTGINCSTGAPIVLDGIYESIGNGFRGMSAPSGAAPGTVNVNYFSGSRQITLRITDNEGLQTKTSVTVNVN